MFQKNLKIAMCVWFMVAGIGYAEDDKEASDSEWKHESELGLAGTGGNAKAASYQGKHASNYTWSANTVALSGMFFYARSNGVDSARTWQLDSRYEREVSERLRFFLGHGWQGNEPAGYRYRIATDLGAKYFLIPGDKKDNYLFTELGYQFRYEARVPGVVPGYINNHFIRTYFEAAHQLTESVSAKLWVEFLPDVSNSTDFQLNFEPSLSVILTGNFFLKVGFLGKFDNLPAAAEKFDFTYTTSLVAKF